MIERMIRSEMMDLVQKSLDASALQHRAISNNLANVDTPGYKRVEVLFQEKLKKAFSRAAEFGTKLDAGRTDPRHLAFSEAPDLSTLKPQMEIQNNTSLRNDQNNVDIDVEMAKLAQNTVVYQTLAQLAQSRFSELRTAISEGRR